MKVDEGKITVEVRPDVLQKVKDNLRQVINPANVRGLALFFGFGTFAAVSLTPSFSDDER
jgi:hypothetical protein